MLEPRARRLHAFRSMASDARIFLDEESPPLSLQIIGKALRFLFGEMAENIVRHRLGVKAPGVPEESNLGWPRASLELGNHGVISRL
jgi:hypothetical protein